MFVDYNSLVVIGKRLSNHIAVLYKFIPLSFLVGKKIRMDPTDKYVDRETIERYLCSTGLEKAQRKFVGIEYVLKAKNFHFVQQTTYDCGPACCWMIMFDINLFFIYRKWAKRFIMNDDFDYQDFLQGTCVNFEDGVWTVDLVKVLKDYSFR